MQIHEAPPVVKIQSLSMQYQGAEQAALRDIHLTVYPAELLSLVGESGSGKSSLLRAIAGLEKVKTGTIHLNGIEVSSTKKHSSPQQRKVGMVFQDYALFPHMRVAENIAFGISKKPDSAAQIARVLALVGLEGFARRFPHELSGGEQQRVALARALAAEPGLLLLDEPFSNLDEALKEVVRQDTYRILKQSKMTTLLVTHDIRDALTLSDRIAVLKEGQLQQLGSPEDIYDRPVNTYVARLFGKINIFEHGQLEALQILAGVNRNVLQLNTGYQKLGVRPEQFDVSLTQQNGSREAKVIRRSFLGAVEEVDVLLDNTTLTLHVLTKFNTFPETIFIKIKDTARLCQL